MTNQTIPAGISPEEAKKAREWALHALNKPGASNTAEKAVARVVIGTAPPRPTLADMTPDERDKCKGMQADLAQGDRVVILDGHAMQCAIYRPPNGGGIDCDWEAIP